MRALLAAALLALSLAPAAAIAEEDEFGNEIEPADEKNHRLSITAWGGEAIDTASGPNLPILGGEVAWAFDALDVGVAGYGYKGLRQETGRPSRFDPVILARVTQRFETYRGLEAGFTLGAGAAREDHWRAWFQLALGLRLDLGPAFLAGEIGFEQQSLFRLAAGVGVRLF